VTLDPPVLTDTVTINYPVDLRLVSDLVAAPMDELMALNPSLLRLVTPPDASFDLHLPGGMAAVFEQRIAAIPEAKRNAWRYHRVVPEDTLASVAREYRVTVDELAAANQLRSADGIEGVEALVVPVAPSAPPSERTRLYTVRKGETLVTISDRFGVSLNQLRRWNNITGIRVQPGRRLHVADPASMPHTASRKHRAGSSPTAHARSSAPPKGATAKSAGPAARKKSNAPPARHAPVKRSGAAAGAKRSGTTGAGKPSVKKPVVHSKTHATK
jgi:membrane-bound lytic murein transglycosylase D